MTAIPAGTVAALLTAISDHLTPTWDQRDTFGDGAYVTAATDVKLAIAAITGHVDPAAVERFTALLAEIPPGHTGELAPNHIDAAGQVVAAFHPGDCITCHGHVGADGVFTPAGAA